ncbi:MAG: helix-turn-helix transcriptional regulator [Phycisphaerales bacterium]|nr:helix-turn-helix transcriptional regulator [Phycisphaerales bacterium]
MAVKIKKKYTVQRQDQLKALASTLRFDLFFELARLGGGTIRQVAERLEKSPASLYRHMTLLVECDLVRVEGTASEGPSKADVYVPIAHELLLPKSADHPDLMDGATAVLRAQCRNCEDEFISGYTSPKARFRGPQRNLYMVNCVSWLTKSELGDVNSLLNDIYAILNKAEPWRKNTEQIGVTLTVRPIEK